MPLNTREVDLSAELDRLEDERKEIADQAAEISPDNPAFDGLVGEGQSLDTHIRGLSWALDEWDADTVTLSGLTGGEFGKVEDELADAAAKRDRRGGQPGARRVYLVAFGTVDAPFVDDEMSDDERIASAAGLPVAFLKWAESQVNELSTVGNGSGSSSFTQLLAEKRSKTQGSTASSSSD